MAQEYFLLVTVGILSLVLDLRWGMGADEGLVRIRHCLFLEEGGMGSSIVNSTSPTADKLVCRT